MNILAPKLKELRIERKDGFSLSNKQFIKIIHINKLLYVYLAYFIKYYFYYKFESEIFR